MKVIICDTSEEMSKRAARIFAESIKGNPKIVIGLATGGTPVKMYQELIRLHREGGLDFSKVTSFNLDEYLGLSGDHEQSFRYFMDKNLFNHINIDKKRTHVLNGKADNPEGECRDFERKIKEAGGIDIQLLGIGSNGHIAFNEPDSKLDSRTRVVSLSSKTIKDNSRFFKPGEEVPKKALSLGIGTILEAREIVLIADGEGKADAIAQAVESPVSEKVPASFLQRHSNCTIIIDKTAAKKLKGSYAIGRGV